MGLNTETMVANVTSMSIFAKCKLLFARSARNLLEVRRQRRNMKILRNLSVFRANNHLPFEDDWKTAARQD